MIPAPLLKPKFVTTTTASMAHTYEVVLTSDDAPQGIALTPRPRVGFDPDDAIVALLELLKVMNLSPDELLTQFPGHQLAAVLEVVTTVDGKDFLQFRRVHAPFTHVSILAKMKEWFPQCMGVAPVARVARQEVIEDGGSRMESMHNSGSQNSPTDAQRRLADAPKVRKVTTVYQGGGDKADQLAEVIKGLTPENIPAGGLVLTMGKNGPRLLKTASTRTDDEEGEDNLSDSSGSSLAVSRPERTEINTSARSQAAPSVSMHRDPNTMPPGVPDPRPKPVAKVAAAPGPAVTVMTGDQMERTAKVAPLKKTPSIGVLDEGGFEMDMGSAEAAALVDQEMGSVGAATPDIQMPTDISIGDNGEAPSALNAVAEHGGRRIRTQAAVIKKDRGGTRPKTVPR